MLGGSLSDANSIACSGGIVAVTGVHPLGGAKLPQNLPSQVFTKGLVQTRKTLPRQAPPRKEGAQPSQPIRTLLLSVRTAS